MDTKNIQMSDGIRFHFVLDKELYDKLKEISKIRGEKKSEIIHKILLETVPFVEKADFTIRNGKDSDFGEKDMKMIRKMRITISSKFKRDLFLLQQHFLLRSKGEILRHIIRMYFKKEAKIEGIRIGKFVRVVNRFKQMWEAKLKKQKRWCKLDFVHMPTSMDQYINCEYDPSLKLTYINYTPPNSLVANL